MERALRCIKGPAWAAWVEKIETAVAGVLLIIVLGGTLYLVYHDSVICAHGHKMVRKIDGTFQLYKGILIPCER